jgi:hypothetical protein
VRSSRLTLILVAAVVGALAVAGLFVHGPGGGVLLGVVVAVLVLLSSATWSGLPRRGRITRGLVISAVAAVAVLKFAGVA